jgi:glyoxylase-like metal-dependent hydrolase (beta-lactamase superfamily II)
MSSFQELYPGLHYWVTMVTMENMQVPLGGLYLIKGEERVLIDPALPEGGFAAWEAYGKPTAVVLTSDSHDRDTVKVKDHYQIPVFIHESMAEKVEGLTGAQSFKDGATLPGGLRAVDLPGLEETVFLLDIPGGTLLLVGDAIIDMGQGPQPLPAQWVRNPSGYAADLKKMTGLSFTAVWLSHGGLHAEKAGEVVQGASQAQEAQLAKA